MSDLQKLQLVEHLFKLKRVEPECEAWVRNAFRLLQVKFPDLSLEFFEDLYTTYGPSYLIEKWKELHLEYFSEGELRKMNEFWASDVGKKLVIGDYPAEHISVSVQWAQSLDSRCESAERRRRQPC